jgi:hypothetical protein
MEFYTMSTSMAIEKELVDLLATVGSSMSRKDKGLIEEFIDVGEYGLALETVCASLRSFGDPISDELKERVTALQRAMNMDDNEIISSLLRMI